MEVWDSEDAKETEPYGFTAWERAEAEARAQEAEARAKQAEERDSREHIVRLESKLDKFFAQQPAPLQPAAEKELKALPTVQPNTAPSKTISFARRGNKTVATQGPWSDHKALQTYETLSQLLGEVRTAILNSKNQISEKELRAMFKSTPLRKAADDSDWKGWIEDVASDPDLTAKGMALVFLENKTRLKRTTLEKKFSNARSEIKKSNL